MDPVNCPLVEGPQPSTGLTCEIIPTWTPKLQSQIHILMSKSCFQISLKLQETAACLADAAASSSLIIRPRSAGDLPRTLWRFVQLDVFIWMSPSSSAVDNSAFQWPQQRREDAAARTPSPAGVSVLSRVTACSLFQTLTLEGKFPPTPPPEIFKLMFFMPFIQIIH